MKTLFVLIFQLIYSMSILAQSWKPAAATVNFKTKMFGMGINGSFKGLTGTVVFDANNLPAASINVSVDAKTVDTDNFLRNKHLREKEEFFNVIKYPTIAMKTTKIEKTPNGFVGYFDLTMKATTKNVKIPFSFVQTDNTGQFKGSVTINRNDWKVGGSTMGMSDDVTLTLQLNVVQ
jgi:polyisoprenoid-binding protein YceI